MLADDFCGKDEVPGSNPEDGSIEWLLKLVNIKCLRVFFVSCFSLEVIGALSCIGLYTQSGEPTSANNLNLSRKEFYTY
jgi:hypothetical protein